jgi:hypothetical protein
MTQQLAEERRTLIFPVDIKKAPRGAQVAGLLEEILAVSN